LVPAGTMRQLGNSCPATLWLERSDAEW
jgi:hypothetical protein